MKKNIRRFVALLAVACMLGTMGSALADDLNVDGKGECPEYTFTNEDRSFEKVNVSNGGALKVDEGAMVAENVSLSDGASIVVDEGAYFYNFNYNDDPNIKPAFKASDATVTTNSGEFRVTDATVTESKIDNNDLTYFYNDTEISESEINNLTENSELYFSPRDGDGSDYTTSVTNNSTINNEGSLYFYTKTNFTDSTLYNDGGIYPEESVTFEDSTLNNSGEVSAPNLTFTGDSQVQNDCNILCGAVSTEEPEDTSLVIGGNTHLINGSADNADALIQSAIIENPFEESGEYEPFGEGQTIIQDEAVVDNYGQFSSGYEVLYGGAYDDHLSLSEGKIVVKDDAVFNNKETGLIDNGGLQVYQEIYGERVDEWGLSENAITNVELEGGTFNNEGSIDIAFDSDNEKILDEYEITHGTLSVSGGTLNNMDGGTVQTDTIIMSNGTIDNSGSITTDTLSLTGGTLLNNESGTVTVLNDDVTIEKGSDSESDVIEGGFLQNVGTMVVDTVTYYGLSLVKGLDDTGNVIVKQIEKAAEFIFANCFSLDGFNLIGFQSSEDAGVIKNVGESIVVNSVSKWIALWESANIPEPDDTPDKSSHSSESEAVLPDRPSKTPEGTAGKDQISSEKVALFSADEMIKADLNSESGKTIEIYAWNTDEGSMVAITDKDTIIVMNQNEVVNESMYSISLINGKMRLSLTPALIRTLGTGTHELTVYVNNMEYQISVTIY